MGWSLIFFGANDEQSSDLERIESVWLERSISTWSYKFVRCQWKHENMDKENEELEIRRGVKGACS